MIKRCALPLAALSLGAIVSTTGAIAQTYVAPGGSPVATAPGGLDGRSGVTPRGAYDDITTGALRGRPSGSDAYDARAEALPDGGRDSRRAR